MIKLIFICQRKSELEDTEGQGEIKPRTNKAFQWIVLSYQSLVLSKSQALKNIVDFLLISYAVAILKPLEDTLWICIHTSLCFNETRSLHLQI